jgi:aryl-alcohol dehydrogenase-like predicted oxidoreductase
MKTNLFGNTNRQVSEIGLGCWQLGGDWGEVTETTAFDILNAAVDNGVTFLDTADVYGGGRSEQLIGQFLKTRSEGLFVATKVGRYNFPGPYTRATLRQHINDSLKRLDVESLDLVQLHCIPTEVTAEGSIFEWLRELQQDGAIRNFGASVESVAEGVALLDTEGITSLQVIFNIFRQKPIGELFDKAQEKSVGIIVRLPLASGLLAGKFTKETTFAEDDHRTYNRDGQAFNTGETFAGIPFERGVELANLLKQYVPEGMTMAQFSQRWVADHPAVSTIITGASLVQQATDNAAVTNLAPLSDEMHAILSEFYKKEVHQHIRGVY